MLVLIAMQKLASSSVAAITKTLRTRLERLRMSSTEIREKIALNTDESDILLDDEQYLEALLAESTMALMEHEIPHLEERSGS